MKPFKLFIDVAVGDCFSVEKASTLVRVTNIGRSTISADVMNLVSTPGSDTDQLILYDSFRGDVIKTYPSMPNSVYWQYKIVALHSRNSSMRFWVNKGEVFEVVKRKNGFIIGINAAKTKRIHINGKNHVCTRILNMAGEFPGHSDYNLHSWIESNTPPEGAFGEACKIMESLQDVKSDLPKTK